MKIFENGRTVIEFEQQTDPTLRFQLGTRAHEVSLRPGRSSVWTLSRLPGEIEFLRDQENVYAYLKACPPIKSAVTAPKSATVTVKPHSGEIRTVPHLTVVKIPTTELIRVRVGICKTAAGFLRAFIMVDSSSWSIHLDGKAVDFPPPQLYVDIPSTTTAAVG